MYLKVQQNSRNARKGLQHTSLTFFLDGEGGDKFVCACVCVGGEIVYLRDCEIVQYWVKIYQGFFPLFTRK